MKNGFSLREFTQRFFECEATSGFFEEQLDGRVVWDYLRYPLFEILVHQELVRHRGLPTRADHFVSYPESLGRKMAIHLGEIKGLGRQLWRRFGGAERGPFEGMILNYDRKNWISGKKINIQFYFFAEALSRLWKLVVVDPSRFQEEVESHYPCHVVRSRLLEYRIRLKAKRIRFGEGDWKLFRHFQAVLEKRLSVSFDIGQSVPWFAYQLAGFDEYARLFEKYQPRWIIYSETGSCKGWIERAHQMGIKVIDCHHALISPYNIVYQYPQEIGPNQLKTLPDFIFTFGEFWHPHFRIPVPLLPVGFPYFEAKWRETPPPSSDRQRRLLIISSMISARHLERLAIELADQLPDFEIVYKLRPDEYTAWRSIYSREFQARKNISVIERDIPSLYELFSKSEYQVGVNSTALIEGLASGLTTFILNDGWCSEMDYFVDSGSVFLVEGAKEIVEKIRGGQKPLHQIPPGQIFRNNAGQNVCEAIQRLEVNQWLL